MYYGACGASVYRKLVLSISHLVFLPTEKKRNFCIKKIFLALFYIISYPLLCFWLFLIKFTFEWNTLTDERNGFFDSINNEIESWEDRQTRRAAIFQKWNGSIPWKKNYFGVTSNIPPIWLREKFLQLWSFLE